MTQQRDRQTGRYVHEWGVVAHDRRDGEAHDYEQCALCGRYMRDGRMLPAGREPRRSAVQVDTDRPFWPGGQHERVGTIQQRGPIGGRLLSVGVTCSCGHEIVEPVRDGGIEVAEARVVEREAQHQQPIAAVLR